MPVKQRAWQTLCEPKYGKPVKIVVWKNKEFNCPSQEVTLHPKFMRSWNAALGYITFVLQPGFGAVRKLYNLDTKKLVLCLEEIQQNHKYVAVGAEKVRFRKCGYLGEFPKMHRQAPKPRDSPPPNYDVLNFMVCTKKNKRTVLYLMVSGRACQVPIKIVLIERDFTDYNMILEYLAHRLDVGEGIQNLCDIRGKPIQNPGDLQHGQLYIAVPHASSFIQLDYLELFSKLLPQKTLKAAKPKRGKRKRADNTKADQATSEIDDDVNGKQEEVDVVENAEGIEMEDGNGETEEESPRKSDKHVEVQIDSDAEWEKGKSSSGHAVLQAKCIGEKCMNQACMVFRKEYASLPASLFNLNGNLEQSESDDLGEYGADLLKTVGDIASSDMDTVRHILDDIVDDTMVQVKQRGIATPAFIKSTSMPVLQEEDEGESIEFYDRWAGPDDAVGSRDQSMTTEELDEQLHDTQLTTFADIARNRELDEKADPLFAFDLVAFRDRLRPEDKRLSQPSRKGVSFMQVISPDEHDNSPSHDNLPYPAPPLPACSILKIKSDLVEADNSFCTTPRIFLHKSAQDVLEKATCSSRCVQKNFSRQDKAVQVPELEQSAINTELLQTESEPIEVEHDDLSDIYENYNQAEPSMREVVDDHPLSRSQSNIEQSKSPRTSILKRISNSPVKLAKELKTHLPVVVQPSFVRIRSSITHPHSDAIKRRLSELLQQGVDIVSDEKINVNYEEEVDEEDSLNEDPISSKGIQKDWKLNDDIFERAVQTGAAEILDEIVDAASQTSDENHPRNGNRNSI